MRSLLMESMYDSISVLMCEVILTENATEYCIASIEKAKKTKFQYDLIIKIN